jgi:DNA-binding MarR family transcriptional regulator
MDQIKEAFQKVKQDMDSMREEINILNSFLYENRELLSNLDKKIQDLTEKMVKIDSENPSFNPTDNPQNSTIPTHIPTDNSPFKPLNTLNLGISTGNQGVPTNKQTNKPTNQQMENTSFGDAIEILNSLDNIKKEIRAKFKKITDQEFLVFSTIYQMEEEGYVDYKMLAQKLNLTETSIRDYIGKLIKKGIPVEKTKVNNKLVQLSISKSLRKIAPLPVIFQLREL